MADTRNTPVRATATSFRIVEALVARDGAGVSELASHLDLSKSTIHDHLATLEALGYVDRDEDGSAVSLEWFRIGTHARAGIDVYHRARSEVDQLASSSGLNAGLVVARSGVGHCLYSRVGTGVDEPIIAEGATVPLHATGVGKAILSEVPSSTVRDLFGDGEPTAYTENTITSYDAFTSELETVRNHGVAFEEREYRDDVRGIGTAVTDDTDGLVGGLFLTADDENLTGKQLRQNNPGLLISAKNRLGNTSQPPTSDR